MVGLRSVVGQQAKKGPGSLFGGEGNKPGPKHPDRGSRDHSPLREVERGARHASVAEYRFRYTATCWALLNEIPKTGKSSPIPDATGQIMHSLAAGRRSPRTHGSPIPLKRHGWLDNMLNQKGFYDSGQKIADPKKSLG